MEFTTSGSAGQGILLVDGPLHVGGDDFTFYGQIIVQGDCVFEYQSQVYGGILAPIKTAWIKRSATPRRSAIAPVRWARP